MAFFAVGYWMQKRCFELLQREKEITQKYGISRTRKTNRKIATSFKNLLCTSCFFFFLDLRLKKRERDYGELLFLLALAQRIKREEEDFRESEETVQESREKTI